MGRKSGGRKPQNVRHVMKGLKNRWGRFQCPSDGSICKSLEAWHWHRLKYHATQNINFIDLDGDDDSDVRTTGNKRSSPTPHSPHSPHTHSHHLGVSSIAIIPPQLHLPPLSPSERLLPPEAFAPLRPEIIIPDDVSDLTEPEIPVLLSEETTTMMLQEDCRQIENSAIQATEKETNNENKNREQEDHFPNDCSSTHHPNHIHHHSSPIHQTPSVNFHSNHRSLSTDKAVANSNGERTSIQMTSSDHGSIFRSISMQVIEMLDPRKKSLTVEAILPRVEESCSHWGLNHDAIVGVVTGTLVAALDQWKHGYEAGWRDGVKEVLRSPLLTNLSLQRHSPGGDTVGLLSPDSVE